MKKHHIKSVLILMGISVFGITLLSNASGPGGDRTGAPGSSGKCNSCHGGTSNLGGDIVLTALDVATTKTVTSYEPGKKYTISIKMGGTSLKKGFQATVIDGTNKAIGTVSNVSAGATSYTSGSKTIVGHNTPGLGVWYFDWTAPSASAGTITVYAAGVVSNANNNDNGDQVVSTTLALTAPVSAVKTASNITLSIYPNPCLNTLKFSETLNAIEVFALNGSRVLTLEQAQSISVESLIQGKYYLIAKRTDGKLVHSTFVKQ